MSDDSLSGAEPVSSTSRGSKKSYLLGKEYQRERLLADIRDIKAALAEEDDPDEQRHLPWLLKGLRRKVTGHHTWLESLRTDPRAGPDLEAQIALFIMREHECRIGEQEERPA